MGKITFKYDRELYFRLEENKEVETLVVAGDILLKIITPIEIEKDPQSCLDATQNCLYFFKKAKNMTEEEIIINYCDKRIKETFNAMECVSRHFPMMTLEELIEKI
jgi:hypothetical protein